MNVPIIDEVVEQLKIMPLHLQWQVLEFIRALVKLKFKVLQGDNCYVSQVQSFPMISS